MMNAGEDLTIAQSGRAPGWNPGGRDMLAVFVEDTTAKHWFESH